MKAAAGAVAVLAWGSLLAAMWYPLAAGVRPSGAWFGVAIVSLLVALVAPAFLLGLDKQPGIGPAKRNAERPAGQWTTRTTRRERSRAQRPSDDTERDE